MIKQFTLAAAALAMGATAIIPATPAAAQRYGDRYYGQRYDGQYRNGYYSDGRYYDRSYRNSYDYRARQKCKDGDGGTVIGAIAGGLLGSVIAGRGDKTLGAVLGGAGGALAGRAIDRSDRPEYCRR